MRGYCDTRVELQHAHLLTQERTLTTTCQPVGLGLSKGTMAMQQERHGHRGFTLLEVIVTLLVLGILGALAVVSYGGAYERSKDEKAALTLEAALREAQAVAAFRGGEDFLPEDFAATSIDVEAVGTGVHAAAFPTVFSHLASDRYGVVAYAIAPGYREVATAMRSETGACLFAMLHYDVPPDAKNMGRLDVCTGRAAGEALAEWSPIPPPEGVMPTVPEDYTATGEFTSDSDTEVLVAPTADGPWSDGTSLEEGQLQVTGSTVSTEEESGVSSLGVSLSPLAVSAEPVKAKTTVRFAPRFAFAGEYTFWVRSRDLAGNLSKPVQVPAEVVFIPHPTPPDGDLPDGLEGRTVRAPFSTIAKWRPAWYFEIATSKDGPWTRDTVSVPNVGSAVIVDDDPSDTVSEVAFTPVKDFVGKTVFWVRATDGINKLSDPAPVGVVTNCDPSIPHLLSSPCASANGPALVAAAFDVTNNTTVKGDFLVSGKTSVRNNVTFSAGEEVGLGSIIGGSLSVANGSNVSISGDVWLHGDFYNDSPSTVIGGNVKSYSGSAATTKAISVGGKVLVNSPGTITGSYGTAVTEVGPSIVEAPPKVTMPRYDAAQAPVFDHTFATWAEFKTWWASAAPSLGGPSTSTVRVTDPSAATLDLSGNVVINSHVLVVADGPMTFSRFPSGDLFSSITLISLSTSSAALTAAYSGTTDSDLTISLHTPGTLTFSTQSEMYGQALAPTVIVSQQTTLHAKPPAYWAGRVLVQDP